MSLSLEERKRKEELFKKYSKYYFLTLDEIKELVNLIKKDESIDKNLKPLLLFGLRQFAISRGYKLSEDELKLFEYEK
jgi:hypothetical protein